jgi:hypothetical protein
MNSMKSAAAVAVALLLSACGREETKPVRQPNDYRTMIEHARKRQASSAGLKTVTDAMRKFEVDLGRAPKDLTELVRLGYIEEVPPPPDGQTYVYDPELANVQLAPLSQQAAPDATSSESR